MNSDVPTLMTGCRWVDPPVDAQGNGVESWAIEQRLGFKTPRLFWLTHIAENQWRGRHAHRESILATFAVSGRCRVILDDGSHKQSVTLTERKSGLVIGPWIWHELIDFSPDAAILVVASTRYDESEYIRDYGVFLREAAAR